MFIGHISLPLPVCNPLFYNTILKLLKMSCVTCHHFKVEDHMKRLYLVQQELLDHGMVIQAQEAQEILLNQTGGEVKFGLLLFENEVFSRNFFNIFMF